jgi:dolichol-phosphate mannosyltransferase
VTVVMPAYNEEENLPELFDRVRAVADEVRECDFEFLLIDNCSQDRTETLARKFVAEDRRWRYLRFSRNFGFETSLVAGLHYARGDALVFLPSDMQDPPEAIPKMVAKWREGYDVVYGQLARRRDDSLLKTLGARIAYKLIYHLSDVKIPENASDFRLISRPVIEALKRCGERNRYLRGLVHWVGFRQHGFSYERAPRSRGRSKAGLGYCFGFAVTALVTFSAKPLRWASILGLFAVAASVVGAFVYTLLYALHRFQMGPDMPLPGWTTIVLLILFFGGVQCLFLGILGEYLGNVHIEVKRRPLWVVDRTAGFPAGMGPPRSSDRAGVLHGRTHEWEGQTLAFHECPAGTIDGPDTEIPETRDSSPVHA